MRKAKLHVPPREFGKEEMSLPNCLALSRLIEMAMESNPQLTLADCRGVGRITRDRSAMAPSVQRKGRGFRKVKISILLATERDKRIGERTDPG